MRLRPQRGSFGESMAEALHVDGIDGLRAHLGIGAGARLEVGYYGHDDRGGWGDTYVVKVDGVPVGFADTAR